MYFNEAKVNLRSEILNYATSPSCEDRRHKEDRELYAATSPVGFLHPLFVPNQQLGAATISAERG
jgi:hypothetical protein